MLLFTGLARIFPIVLLASCSAAAGTGEPALANQTLPEPAAIIAALEARLLAEPFHLRYRVTSSGAFVAQLDGMLHLSDQSHLSAAGFFGDSPVEVRLMEHADSLRIESPRGTLSESTPPRLREALAIGLVRMGVLHNLARLTGGLAPDRAGGGVREWLELRDIRADTASAPYDEWMGVRFEIYVSGARAAEAVLWFDRATGLPVRREQVVSFPGGAMRVVEEYDIGRGGSSW
jgi:hypothetical protein